MSLWKFVCIVGASIAAFFFWGHSIAAAALVAFALFAMTTDFGPRVP